MRLYDFLECFEQAAQVRIYDEEHKEMIECEVGDVPQRILNCRCVSESKCDNNIVTIYTVLKNQEELDKLDEEDE